MSKVDELFTSSKFDPLAKEDVINISYTLTHIMIKAHACKNKAFPTTIPQGDCGDKNASSDYFHMFVAHFYFIKAKEEINYR